MAKQINYRVDKTKYKTKEDCIRRLNEGEPFSSKFFDNFRNDKDVALTAVKNDSGNMRVLSADFQDNDEIVFAAVSRSGYGLNHSSERLRNNKELVLLALKTCGVCLRYASADLKNDKEVVLAAVLYSGGALQYAGSAPQDDIRIVLAAIKKDNGAFEYASLRIKEMFPDAQTAIIGLNALIEQEDMEKAIPEVDVQSKKLKV